MIFNGLKNYDNCLKIHILEKSFSNFEKMSTNKHELTKRMGSDFKLVHGT